jgi:class 3 adenylate cyclase
VNIDIKGSSDLFSDISQEYARKLTFRDYHTLVEETVSSSEGSKVAWAGDGGTSEFTNPESAVSVALTILESSARHPRISNLVLRIGIAGGLELLDPSCEIGKRTSQTHNRAGHYQKLSNDCKVTIGPEIYEALSDKLRFQKRPQIDGEIVYESK